ncbi:MAG: hypothetical protein PUC12_12310 [Clostridiales bacterium]|nr:hypothetical protein [Clostridiales bacterium]
MKQIKKIILVLLLVVVCLVGILQFVFGGVDMKGKNNVQKNNPSEVKNRKEPEGGESDDVWQEMAKKYLGDIPDIHVYSPDETMRQDDWSYEIKNARVTKEKDPRWDSIPDYPEYEYDEDGNILNSYSFLSVGIRVLCEEKSPNRELCLNSMYMAVFDETGEKVYTSEAATAALGKPFTKNYFYCSLEKGELLDTEIVYMMPDKYVKNNYYYLMIVNNHGVTPETGNEVGLMKIPIGEGK